MSDDTHRWGRSALGSSLAHLRETEGGTVVARNIAGQRVGRAVCGAWLVDDVDSPIDSPHIRMCARCLAVLVAGPPSDHQP